MMMFNHPSHLIWGPNRLDRGSQRPGTPANLKLSTRLWLASSCPWKSQHWAELSLVPLRQAKAIAKSLGRPGLLQAVTSTHPSDPHQPLLYFLAHVGLFWTCHKVNGYQWNGALRLGPSSSHVALDKTKMLKKKPSEVAHGLEDRELPLLGGQASLSSSDL